MTHTPGLWEVVNEYDDNQQHYSDLPIRTMNKEKPVKIAKVFRADDVKVGEANAHLIAAAPEMLKCLQAIVARIHGVYDDPALIEWGGLHHDSNQDILVHAEKLIAKATGEQHEP